MADQSILNSTKKILGIDSEYTVFDLDIITHINSVLAILNDLGLGPENGFMIEDATATWDDFLGPDNPKLNPAKTYLYLRVRMLFDPPATAYLATAFSEQVKELEWRLNTVREATEWVDPDPVPALYCDPFC